MISDPFTGWCPACGDPVDYCLGHGEIGDPYGYQIVRNHDEDLLHNLCHPAGCATAELEAERNGERL